MSTSYPSESFFRSNIRQTIEVGTLPPFTLKVTKVPTLSTWLLTISPNTNNEEIVEYSAVDAVNLTITVSKRGIKWDSQVLTTDGAGAATWDYNNSVYMRAHSQNDQIQADVTHLHLIQDYAAKLDANGWLRTWMTPNSLPEINNLGVEVQRTISASSPLAGDLIQSIDPVTRVRREFTYSSIDLTGDTFTEGETIATLDAVWISPWNGKLYKTRAPSASTTSIGSPTGMFGTVVLDETRILWFYYTAGNTFARAWTIVNDVVTWWTAVTIASWAASMFWACALVWVNTVSLVSSPNVSSTTQTLTHTIVTVSWTTITVWSNVLDAIVYAGNTNIRELNIEPLRSNAYLVSVNQGSSSSPWQHIRLMNFTWTTPSFISQNFAIADFGVEGWRMRKLADNVVAIARVTPHTSITECTVRTFTWNSVTSTATSASASLININSICKINSTSFMVSNNTTSSYLLTVNGSSLNLTPVTFPVASTFLTYLWDNLYSAIVSWTMYIRQFDITLATLVVSWWIDDTVRYDGWARIYHIWSGTTTIYNIMYWFHEGFRSSTSKILSFLSYITWTWFIIAARYYLNPATWTISPTVTSWKYIWDAISTTKIQIKT